MVRIVPVNDEDNPQSQLNTPIPTAEEGDLLDSPSPNLPDLSSGRSNHLFDKPFEDPNREKLGDGIPLGGNIPPHLDFPGDSDSDSDSEDGENGDDLVINVGPTRPASFRLSVRKASIMLAPLENIKDSLRFLLRKTGEKPLKDLLAVDGKAIGTAFNFQLKIERKKKKTGHIKRCVAIVIGKHVALNELVDLYPCFGGLMEGILDNHLAYLPNTASITNTAGGLNVTAMANLSSLSLRETPTNTTSGASVAVSRTLANITNDDAKAIGDSLSKSLKAKKSAAAGVDQWVLQNDELVAFVAIYHFFVPMCVIIGRQQVMDAPWGMKFRVYLGAILSTLDMITDVIQIIASLIRGGVNMDMPVFSFYASAWV